MTIDYNEMTGAVSFSTTKDLEFPLVVQLFCQLMIQFVRDGIQRQNAAMREASKTPPATS